MNRSDVDYNKLSPMMKQYMDIKKEYVFLCKAILFLYYVVTSIVYLYYLSIVEIDSCLVIVAPYFTLTKWSCCTICIHWYSPCFAAHFLGHTYRHLFLCHEFAELWTIFGNKSLFSCLLFFNFLPFLRLLFVCFPTFRNIIIARCNQAQINIIIYLIMGY